MSEIRMRIAASYKDICFPQIQANGTDNYFVPKLSFQKRPTDGYGEEEPPFLLPPPPLLHLPSVPISTKAHWRPKIPTNVINNMRPVSRSAYENKIQGGQGGYSRDLPKGNQQRAMVHHKVLIQCLLHSTGCC